MSTSEFDPFTAEELEERAKSTLQKHKEKVAADKKKRAEEKRIADRERFGQDYDPDTINRPGPKRTPEPEPEPEPEIVRETITGESIRTEMEFTPESEFAQTYSKYVEKDPEQLRNEISSGYEVESIRFYAEMVAAGEDRRLFDEYEGRQTKFTPEQFQTAIEVGEEFLLEKEYGKAPDWIDEQIKFTPNVKEYEILPEGFKVKTQSEEALDVMSGGNQRYYRDKLVSAQDAYIDVLFKAAPVAAKYGFNPRAQSQTALELRTGVIKGVGALPAFIPATLEFGTNIVYGAADVTLTARGEGIDKGIERAEGLLLEEAFNLFPGGTLKSSPVVKYAEEKPVEFAGMIGGSLLALPVAIKALPKSLRGPFVRYVQPVEELAVWAGTKIIGPARVAKIPGKTLDWEEFSVAMGSKMYGGLKRGAVKAETAIETELNKAKRTLENTLKKESKIKTETETKLETETKPETKIETKLETEIETRRRVETEIETKLETKLETEVKPETETETKPETKIETKPETKIETEIEIEIEIETEIETEVETKRGRKLRPGKRSDIKQGLFEVPALDIDIDFYTKELNFEVGDIKKVTADLDKGLNRLMKNL